MPRPTDPDRYPVAFRQALLKCHAEGSFTIPCTNPAGLRSQIYGYFKALRKSGQPELADAVTVICTATTLTLQLRDQSPAALEISAALNSSSPSPITQ